MLLPLLALSFGVLDANAQAWPGKPLRAISPITPGSLSDVAGRLVFEQLSAQFGQPVIVENRPGAGGTIGCTVAARATPDGYTLLVHSSAHTIAQSLYPNLAYDPARDFAAVTPLGVSPFVLVVLPAKGFKTTADLIAAAKAKPGAFNFASPGVGTASHLSAERFRLAAGVKAVHVPLRGGPEAAIEVIAGRADFFFQVIGIAVPNIKAGKLTALAVNGMSRSTALPDVPTLHEGGVSDADYPTWVGLFVPARTPRDIVDKLHRATVMALEQPKVREKLTALGIERAVMTPKEFDGFVQKGVETNVALVSAIGLKPE
jgi:tripartite-type tricarboxylate transporter receptor subunit TctC